MGYPGPNVHRPSRRKLGRGQYPTQTGVSVVATGAASIATLTFARPVVVTGLPPIQVATLTPVSWVQSSPTVVAITMSGAVSTHAYTIPAGLANVATYQGGPVLGTTGTF